MEVMDVPSNDAADGPMPNSKKTSLSLLKKKQRSLDREEIPTTGILSGNQYLQGLVRSMDEMIHMNSEVLNDRKAMEKRRIEEEKNRRREANEKVRKILAKYEKDAQKMPLWKHRARGSMNPPPSVIIKGKSLFRAIAKTVLVLYCKPYMHIYKRKKATRQAEREFLEKTLLLYSASCDKWIAKVVRIPLISLENDTSVDLDFKPHSMFDLFNAHNKRAAVQLKVRMVALIESLTESAVPPDIISNLLIILVDEGNYFKKDFLFDYEKEHLGFDQLGATKFVAPEVEGATAEGKLVKKIGRHFVDITRAKMLVQNYLLVRILIGHIILSPWYFGVCSKPSMGVKRALHNYRVMASMVYTLLCRIDPAMPKVEAVDQHTHFTRHASVSPVGDIENQIKARLSAKGEPSSVSPAISKKVEDKKEYEAVPIAALERSVALRSYLMDEMMLNPRPTFQRLSVLQYCLYHESHFASAATLIEPWLSELQTKLDTWVTNITVQVLEAKLRANDAILGQTASTVYTRKQSVKFSVAAASS